MQVIPTICCVLAVVSFFLVVVICAAPGNLFCCKVYTMIFDHNTYQHYKTAEKEGYVKCTICEYAEALTEFQNPQAMEAPSKIKYNPKTYYVVDMDDGTFQRYVVWRNDSIVISAFYVSMTNRLAESD